MRFESKIKFGCQFISNKAQSVWAPVCGREVTDRNTPADCIIQQEDLAAGYVQILFRCSYTTPFHPFSPSSHSWYLLSLDFIEANQDTGWMWKGLWQQYQQQKVHDQMHYWSTAWNIGINYWKQNSSSSEWEKPGVSKTDWKAVFVTRMRFVSTACLRGESRSQMCLFCLPSCASEHISQHSSLYLPHSFPTKPPPVLSMAHLHAAIRKRSEGDGDSGGGVKNGGC